MDNTDETFRSRDDVAGQLSDAARDLIRAGRAMLDGAERMLNESGQRNDGVSGEQTIQRWVQLGQAAVAGFAEESSGRTSTEQTDTQAQPDEAEPIVGIDLSDHRNSQPADGSGADGAEADNNERHS